MKQIKEKDLLQSTDISLVSALYYFGYKINAIDKTNSARAVFYIERDENIDDLIQSFWSHTLTCDPLTYFNSLKEVKTRLYGV